MADYFGGNFVRSHEGFKHRQEREDKDQLRSLGGKLAEARKAAKLTQVVVAQTLGMKQSDVSKIESGEREPTVFDFARMCAVYGLSLDELIGSSNPWWQERARYFRGKELKKIHFKQQRKLEAKTVSNH